MNCRKCNHEMKLGVALLQTYTSGLPDFHDSIPFDAGQTISAGGPGVLAKVMKCPACGHSVILLPADFYTSASPTDATRRDRMSGARPFIVVGDKTDHGGEVLEGSPKAYINGRMIARVGDKVSCPRCRGTHTIIEGDPRVIVDGRAAAFHGGKTSCGAVLIATMLDNTMGGSAAEPLPPERDWNSSPLEEVVVNASAYTAAQKHQYDWLVGKGYTPEQASKQIENTPEFDRKHSGVTMVERGIPDLLNGSEFRMGPPGSQRIGIQPAFGHMFLEIDPRDPQEVMRYIESRTGEKSPDYFQTSDPVFHQNDELNGGHRSLVLHAQPVPERVSVTGPPSRLVGRQDFVHPQDDAADRSTNGRSWSELETPDYTKLTGKSSGFSDDSVFIGNLILASDTYSDTYPQGLTYDPLPTGVVGRGGVGGYNSNSYVSGILKSAGYDVQHLPDPPYLQPGADAPLPISPQYK